MATSLRFTLRARRREGGYALLLTLLLVLLLAFSILGLSRRSVEHALRALDAEAELQDRWLEVSARRALGEALPAELARRYQRALDRALEDEAPIEERELAACRSLAGGFTLGQRRVSVRFFDEDAKLNLNTLLRHRDKDRVEAFVETVTGGEIAAGSLKPYSEELQKELEAPACVTLAQVLGAFEAKALMNARSHVQRVSPWGSGRLRFSLLEDETLTAFLELFVDSKAAWRLVETRNSNPRLHAAELLQAVPLKAQERWVLRQLLRDDSRSHSLWLSIESRFAERTTVCVEQPGREPSVRRLQFTF